MANTAIRKLTADEVVIKDLTVQILTIPSLRGLQWNLSSPEVIELVMEKIIAAFKTPDPFHALKLEQNRTGQSLYPILKKLVREADDPLQAAVKMAIMGNAIDIMVSDQSQDVEKTLVQGLQRPWPEEPFMAFKKKLSQTRSLVYLGDNCGEIVFDKLLLEIIQETYHPKVVFVVRSAPALNDATRSEAEMVGLDQVAAIMPNGLNAPVPGTILSRCSRELRDLIREADLVISKGGGNFDTLEGEKDLGADISFMLLSKCIPYCQYFQTGMFQPILANVFTSWIQNPPGRPFIKI